MISLTFVNCGVAQLSDVVEHIEYAIRCRSIILQPAQQIDLCIGIDEIDTHQYGMSTGKAFTKLPEFNQTCTGVFLKVALREPAQIGKLTV